MASLLPFWGDIVRVQQQQQAKAAVWACGGDAHCGCCPDLGSWNWWGSGQLFPFYVHLFLPIFCLLYIKWRAAGFAVVFQGLSSVFFPDACNSTCPTIMDMPQTGSWEEVADIIIWVVCVMLRVMFGRQGLASRGYPWIATARSAPPMPRAGEGGTGSEFHAQCTCVSAETSVLIFCLWGHRRQLSKII